MLVCGLQVNIGPFHAQALADHGLVGDAGVDPDVQGVIAAGRAGRQG